MDDLEKGFLDFLSDLSLKSSKLDNVVRDVLAKLKENQDSADEIKQIVLVAVLSKKETWKNILASGKPWAYLHTMVLNTVRDRRRKENGGDDLGAGLARYFRKRTNDILKKSQEFRKFKVGNASSDLWYYTRMIYENPMNLFVFYHLKDFPDLDTERLKPGVGVLRTKDKILEMTGFYLDSWENRERKQLAVKLNDFLDWILGKVDITEVYSGSSPEPRENRNLYDEDGDRIDHDMDRFESEEGFPDLYHDRDTLVRRLNAGLDEREKRCLAMFLEGKTLDEIKDAEGYKGPSGAKALRDRAVGKIRLVMGAMGYLEPGGMGEALDGPLIDILKQVLKYSDWEPSNETGKKTATQTTMIDDRTTL